MILMNQVKMKPGHSEKELKQKVCKLLRCETQDVFHIQVEKQSIDARKRPDIFLIYTLLVTTGNDQLWVKKARSSQISFYEPVVYKLPIPGKQKLNYRPVICGMGPAGLFCAYILAKMGYRPLILERGKCVAERTSDVEAFWKNGTLIPESNVQFGEGGAGTFSDGKLNTVVKDKYGRNRAVLDLFIEHGAPEKIRYEGKPHIGTDVLRTVVENIRKDIISMGGEVFFQTKLTDVLIENDVLKGIWIEQNGKKSLLKSDILVLATGHSARDTFSMLYDKKIEMEAKPFAVGFRVEHPQSLINKSQYGEAWPEDLPAAPYKVTAQTTSQRGVYSFCMCPGGYVVNASSEQGRLAVNGMSYSGRDGKNANSAIIVSVTPEDYPSNHPLSGIEFQRELEAKAFLLAGGKVPVCTFGEFKEKHLSDGQNHSIIEKSCASDEMFSDDFKPQIKGAYEKAEVWKILPEICSDAFVEGMEAFEHKIHGFSHPKVWVDGVESRTSSPVRIIRNEENGESVSLHGLYPCGEGAGYAGGITSAAMDGMKVAEYIVSQFATIS
ncbi:MAG: FAD-dependent oxidoreductase [Lachnospiraceae bacterium]|nr:FAD-dependent oxidoreductase [Lachnospiraceae bacterium]